MAISAGTLGVVPAAPAPLAREGLAAGTRVLLEAPIPGTLLRLAAPNVVVIAVQAAINVLEAVYVGWLGRDALAGIALVFPLVMLMQTMSAGGMGVGIASAIARALGGGRRRDADAPLVLSPALIWGWGPSPRLGIAGAGVAVVTYYCLGSLVLGVALRSRRNLVRLSLRRVRLRVALFRDILRVGLPGALNTIQTNLTVVVLTGLVGAFGTVALAGYGTGARLEYLQIPLVCGLGSALVTMVGTNVGAGQLARARRIALVGGAMAFALTETIGLAAALFPGVWMSLFTRDPAVVAAGSAYLRVVGPSYGFFGLGLALYFASQGAGRVVWPLVARFMRLVLAAVGRSLAIHWLGGGPRALSFVIALAFVLFGVTLLSAVKGGGWRGAPWRRGAAL